MKGKLKKELLKLLKSGNFTVASHDYGQVSIYEGKCAGYNKFDAEGEADFPSKAKEVGDFNLGDSQGGYMQDVVALLVEALGGSNGGSA